MSVPRNEIAPLNDVDADSDEVEVIHLSDDAETKENQTVQIQHEEVAPPTLLETCARFIGQNLPFELVQLHPQRVPEEVQKRISYWSFPLEEERLLEFAKTMHGISEYKISRVMKVINGLGLGANKKRKALRRNWNFYDSHEEDDFQYSRRTKKTSIIHELMKMTQIGMHLTGTVDDFEFLDRFYYHSGSHDTDSPISMCVQFDRGCITSAMCSCCSSSKWCEHVIMLCIARIRGIVPCEIHPPVSEILSHFNRDQLQKLIQHFLEKVPLVGIPPVVVLACQLKDKESEINIQLGAPDPTAGGCAGEVPRWQIDEEVVISHLDERLRNLSSSKDRITGIHNFKEFADFLQNHDENVVTAFKWFLETIDGYHKDRKLESSPYREDRYGDYYYSKRHPLEQSNLVYLVLMQGLQIFFVDPFISKGCKEEIADMLKCRDAFTLSKPLTEQYTDLLQEAVLVSKESPQPTLNYLKKLQLALQGDACSTDRNCREGSKDRSRVLLSSLVAVLRYWLFHKHPCNSACSAVTMDICKSVFPAIPLATSTFEDLVVVNKCLEGIQVSSLLRHGQALMEYLIHSGVDQQEIVNFAAKLLGASSIGMSAIVQTASKDTFLLVTQAEEAILCLAQQHISCERESFTPVLRQIVKEYLHRDVGEGVFIWPWSLLRLVAFDPLMVEEVREVTQSFIGNANSILHCTSQTDQVYPPHVVDLVRDSLLSLLQHLFNTLQPDSAQVLFTTLSNAFPFPITYSAGHSLPDKLQTFPRSIDHEIRELRELKKRMKIGVLPNLQCDPSLLRLIQQNGRFIGANEAIQSILLKAVSAKYSIDDEHETFLKKLSMLQNHRNHSLLFQLQLLCLRVSKCTSGYYGRGSYSSILTSGHKLQLDTPSGHKAFLYLVDNWQYCLSPSEVLDVIVSRLSTNSEFNGHEDEVAQLISTVSLADKDAVKSMRHSFESLVNILALSEDPEHLLVFAESFDANSGAEKLQHVGRALGLLYSRIKGRAEKAISDDDHLVHLKTKFMTILEIITHSTVENQRVLYGSYRYDRRVHVNVREWAPLVCTIGGDAIGKFLTVLQQYHRVDSHGKFPYSFCQELSILWREYSTSLPSGNPSILSVPAFEKITTRLLSEKEENAHNTIKKYRNNAKRVKEAMLLLASFYQPLQLEKEFNSFAFEMSTKCSENVKRMVVRQFVNTPLSAIEIPIAMLNRFHQGAKQKRDQPREQDEWANAHDHIMQHRLYYASMREQYEENMSSSFWSGYGGYYDDMDYDDVDYDDYSSF